MNGIELSKKLYLEHGKQVIENEFADYKDKIAVGVFGKGSECFGFDDEISKDHDYEVGFSLFLTREDEEIIGFKLYRAYVKLAKQFAGKKANESLFGDYKYGVKIIPDYFEKILGFSTIPTNWKVWFHTPDYALAEATNGEIFVDNLGVVTNFRKDLVSKMPADVKLKKIAGHLALAAQTGQYNYNRMVIHEEKVGCQLALADYVKHILSVLFLLDDKFLPYYKWQIRALKNSRFAFIEEDIKTLLTTDNEQQNFIIKKNIVEKLASIVIENLKEKEFSTSNSDYLENHALSVTNNIKSREIKALHIMDYGE